MKKVFSIAIVFFLFFVLNTSVFAGSIYYETMTDGTYSEGSIDHDTSLSVFGYDSQGKRFKFAIDWGSGKTDALTYTDLDLTTYDFKIGVGIINQNSFKAYLTVSKFTRFIDFPFPPIGSFETDGMMVGLDMEKYFTDNLSLEAILAMSTSAEADYNGKNGTTDVDILNYRIKLKYFLGKSFAGTIGYRSNTSSVQGLDFSLAGLTLGINLKF